MNSTILEAFNDEIKKLAAAKARSGSKPIRVDTLASRQKVDKSTSTLKTASLGDAAAAVLGSYALGAGSGALGAGEGKRVPGAALGAIGGLTGGGMGVALGKALGGNTGRNIGLALGSTAGGLAGSYIARGAPGARDFIQKMKNKTAGLPLSYYDPDMPGSTPEDVEAAHRRRLLMGLSGGLQGGLGGMLAGAGIGGLAGLLSSHQHGLGTIPDTLRGALSGGGVGSAIGGIGGLVGGVSDANQMRGNEVEKRLRKMGLTDEEGEEVEKGKTAAVPIPKAAPSFLGRNAGKIGLGVSSIFAWEQGKQALRDYQLGRAIRRQQEQRG